MADIDSTHHLGDFGDIFRQCHFGFGDAAKGNRGIKSNRNFHAARLITRLIVMLVCSLVFTKAATLYSLAGNETTQIRTLFFVGALFIKFINNGQPFHSKSHLFVTS